MFVILKYCNIMILISNLEKLIFQYDISKIKKMLMLYNKWLTNTTKHIFIMPVYLTSNYICFNHKKLKILLYFS